MKYSVITCMALKLGEMGEIEEKTQRHFSKYLLLMAEFRILDELYF